MALGSDTLDFGSVLRCPVASLSELPGLLRLLTWEAVLMTVTSQGCLKAETLCAELLAGPRVRVGRGWSRDWRARAVVCLAPPTPVTHLKEAC